MSHRIVRSLLPVACLLVTALPGWAQQEMESKGLLPRDPNGVVLSLLPSMPTGGGYSSASSATRDLQRAVQFREGKLAVNPLAAPATFCSGATYLVFVRALQLLAPASIATASLAQALAVEGQPDGVGVWGRWNANGPGTACLFRELGLGRSFTSFEGAKPGDFMKIFWSDAVGRREHGHSVIYLGRSWQDGIEMVRFWSSNKPFGYGEKSVPRSRIACAIFSRLEMPDNIRRVTALPQKNPYLSALLAKDSSVAEALAQTGAR